METGKYGAARLKVENTPKVPDFARLDQLLTDLQLPVRPRLQDSKLKLQLSQRDLARVSQSVHAFVQTLEATKAGEVHGQKGFVLRNLKNLGLTISDQFFDEVEDQDIIEGYDLWGFQILRNQRFMEICTYSLEDVLSHTWIDLFERNQSINAKLIESVEKCLSHQTVAAPEVAPHMMKERMSSARPVHMVHFRRVAPLFGADGIPMGILIASKAWTLDPAPERHELSFL